MSKRFCNLVEASLPPPTSVEEFIRLLKSAFEAPAVDGTSDDLFAGVFSEVSDTVVPKGTKAVRKAALALVLEFEQVRLAKGTQPDNLDHWFTLFGKFVMDPAVIVDSEQQRLRIEQQRKELCGTKPMRKVSAPTMRSYVNGIGYLLVIPAAL